jgi:hypothetical protein
LFAGRVYDDKPDNPFSRFDFSLAQVHNGKLTWEGHILKA